MSGEEALAVVEAIKSDPRALDALALALWPRLEKVEAEAQREEADAEFAARDAWRRSRGLPISGED